MLSRALSTLALLAAACAVTQCPNHPTSGCSPPQWRQDWSMRGSLYTYCFNGCALPWLQQYKNLGEFAGVVGIDHYYTKQGMPCVDGIPQEFNAQDAMTNATKATFPDARVLQYRITDAVPYAKVVHDLMVEHPEYFVRWENGTVCQVPPEHETTGFNCSWPIAAAAYDWSQEVVRTWYLDKIIKPTMNVGDGVWLDGDGPDNGAYQCSGSYDYDKLPAPYPALDPAGVAAFCQGEATMATQTQAWVIANGGYDYECFTFVDSPSQLPVASDPAATCAAKLRALDHHVFSSSQAVVLYGSRTDAKTYTPATVPQSVAAFMLTRDTHWFFGLPADDTYPNATAAGYFLTDYGPPLGNMSETSPNVFARKYTEAVVQLDCNTFTAAFTPTN